MGGGIEPRDRRGAREIGDGHEGRADWHTHTHLSDGFTSPAETLGAAAWLGLRRVAITDHDCIDAHRDPRLAQQARSRGCELITGVEIDCRLGEWSVEILGYGFRADAADLAAGLARVQIARRERMRILAERLREAGEPVDPQALLGRETVAFLKVHLYRALAKGGHVYGGGYGEFKCHLESLGELPPLPTPTAAQAVEWVRSAGGFAVLAHPLYYLKCATATALVEATRSAGCTGIEFLYPYDFGPGGIAREEVRAGLTALREAAQTAFPDGPRLTSGTDMHDPAEWAPRLNHLRALEAELLPDTSAR
ncbi:MAG: PHP domain-containing protein [Candidatus Eisenbacteria bacterium]